MTDKPLLVSIKTAAEKLDCSMRQVYDLLKEGELKGERGTFGIKILGESLSQYVEKYQRKQQ